MADVWKLARAAFAGGDELGRTEFARTAYRRTRRRRSLDCGHVIDAAEPYRYHVCKLAGVPGIVQSSDCDFCMRRDNRY